jgi:hypothetical protein
MTMRLPCSPPSTLPGLLLLCFFTLMTMPPGRAAEPTPVAASPAANEFLIQDVPKPVLFFGDDATWQKMYTTLVETYTLSRFPAWKITFRNAGWQGDKIRFVGTRAKSGDQGIRRDIESLHPQIILVNYGVNDAQGGEAAYNQFLVGVNVLSRDMPRVGVNREVLISSNPAEGDEAGKPGGSSFNVMLEKFADGMKERFPIGWQDGVDFVQKHPKGPDVPKIENGVFIDLFHPMLGLLEGARKAGVLSQDGSANDKAARLMPDGIHPNWAGSMIMATIVLQGMHAPALVSSASLDASTRKTVATEGCTIKWQSNTNQTIQFERSDAALPWPIPVECDLALSIPGFDPGISLNRYELKMTGLVSNLYQLSIDGQAIGSVSRDGLARGINLGFVRKGPIYEQGQKLLKAVLAKNDTFYYRWHDVEIGQQFDPKPIAAAEDEARKAELTRLDKLISEQEQALNVLRVPTPHVFKLEPLTR